MGAERVRYRYDAGAPGVRRREFPERATRPDPRARRVVEAFHPPAFRMHIAALFSFIIGAILGLVMAVNHFTGKETGKAFGLGHGVFTVSGLVMLGVGLLYAPNLGAWPTGGVWVAFWAFVVTALGGIFLYSRQITGKKWPSAVVLIHGGAALASIALLIVLLFNVGNGASRDAEPGVVPVTAGADGGSAQ